MTTARATPSTASAPADVAWFTRDVLVVDAERRSLRRFRAVLAGLFAAYVLASVALAAPSTDGSIAAVVALAAHFAVAPLRTSDPLGLLVVGAALLAAAIGATRRGAAARAGAVVGVFVYAACAWLAYVVAHAPR